MLQFNSNVRDSSPKNYSIAHPSLVTNLNKFILMLDTKDYIVKNVGNQTIDGSYRLPYICFIFPHAIEVYG